MALRMKDGQKQLYGVTGRIPESLLPLTTTMSKFNELRTHRLYWKEMARVPLSDHNILLEHVLITQHIFFLFCVLSTTS